jgi:hypothetical protein
MMLDEERAYYDEHLAEWLHQFAGRFVLIKGSALIGTYDTQADALAEGARRFGLAPFLVRRVEQTSSEVQIPALTLGLLGGNGDPARPA